MRSWEADADIVTLLDLVQRTTGTSLKDIVNESIRAQAPSIVRRLLAARKASEAELVLLLEKFPGAAPTPTAATPAASASNASPAPKTRYRPRRPGK